MVRAESVERVETEHRARERKRERHTDIEREGDGTGIREEVKTNGRGMALQVIHGLTRQDHIILLRNLSDVHAERKTHLKPVPYVHAHPYTTPPTCIIHTADIPAENHQIPFFAFKKT